jgi:hypothetical protein
MSVCPCGNESHASGGTSTGDTFFIPSTPLTIDNAQHNCIHYNLLGSETLTRVAHSSAPLENTYHITQFQYLE